MKVSEFMFKKLTGQGFLQIFIFTMLLLQLLVLPAVSLAQERLTVISKIANVRSGPGTGYDILWQVEKYNPFIVLEKKEGWVHFKDFEGDKAWIHNSLVGNVPSVISLKDDCNVRAEPTTDSAIVFTVEKGVPFKLLQTRGDWLNIEHADGDRGWIFKTLVW
jgi:SH3-like domain-containing protein